MEYLSDIVVDSDWIQEINSYCKSNESTLWLSTVAPQIWLASFAHRQFTPRFTWLLISWWRQLFKCSHENKDHIFKTELGLYNPSAKFESKASIIVATVSWNTNTVQVINGSICEAALTILRAISFLYVHHIVISTYYWSRPEQVPQRCYFAYPCAMG